MEKGKGMTSRPKHVSSLSDRIAGLKFMQRGKAVQDQQQSPGSSSLASIKPEEKQVVIEDNIAGTDETETANEEHWTLPSSHTWKQSTSTNAIISHEPGWNAWLFEAEDGTLTGSQENSRVTTRKCFGTWGKKARGTKEEVSGDVKDSDSGLEDDESVDISSEEQQEKPSKTRQGAGFVKPGSITEKSTKKAKQSVNTPTSPSHNKGQRSDKEKKRKSKEGARPLLSGFPEQNKSHKRKKTKS